MGSILIAECRCGYTEPYLEVGGGMRNFMKSSRVPALCRKCKKVVLVNELLPEPHRCPKSHCRSKVVLYNKPALRREEIEVYPVFTWRAPENQPFILPNAYYLCPRCNAMDLRFYNDGNWD